MLNSLRLVLLVSALLIGTAQGTLLHAQSAPDSLPAILDQPAQAPCAVPQVVVRMGGVDDRVTMTINTEHSIQADWGMSGVLFDKLHDMREKLGETQFGESGRIGVTNWMRPGKNTFQVTVTNTSCCGTSLALDIWVNEEQKVKERFFKHYGPLGNTFERTYEIELASCTATSK